MSGIKKKTQVTHRQHISKEWIKALRSKERTTLRKIVPFFFRKNTKEKPRREIRGGGGQFCK